jgi:hypothetical protein
MDSIDKILVLLNKLDFLAEALTRKNAEIVNRINADTNQLNREFETISVCFESIKGSLKTLNERVVALENLATAAIDDKDMDEGKPGNC